MPVRRRISVVALLCSLPAAGRAQMPAGWVQWGPDSAHHTIRLDRQTMASGAASLTIVGDSSGPADGWLGARQFVAASAFAGHRVRILAKLKTRDATDAVLYGKVEGFAGDTVVRWFYDAMNDRDRKGTTDWAEESIVLDVPREATRFVFGSLLNGSGQMWVDDFSISLVDGPEKSTATDVAYFFPPNEWASTRALWAKDVLLPAPRNLGFEEAVSTSRD